MVYRICVLLFIVLSSCTFNVRIVKEPDMISEETIKTLNASVDQYALLSIGDAQIPCKIVGADGEKLTISSKEIVNEIPIKAVNKVYLYGSKKSSGSNMAAMLIAGVTGGFLGDLAGRELGSDKNHSMEIRIGSAVVGACAGMLTIKGMSGSAEKELVVNPTIKLIELYPGVGKSLTGQTIQQRGLFTDLSLGAGESLLKVKIYNYDENQYIAVYEVHNGKDTLIKWFTFDESYFKSQRAKLEQPLKDQIFRNSSLNGQ
jgi:hypothetical protein